MKVDCWFKDKQVNIAAEQEESSNIFMVYSSSSDQPPHSIWVIDSGCSNHMTGKKSSFRSLDESWKRTVKLDDNKEVDIEGEGIVAIQTEDGKEKLLHNVQYIPKLRHNLLSIGQLISGGFSVLFDKEAYLIKDQRTGQILANVQMTHNRMFPLEVSTIEQLGLEVGKGRLTGPRGPDPAGPGRFLTGPCNSSNPPGRVDPADQAGHESAERDLDPDPARQLLKPARFGPNPPGPAVFFIF